MPNGTASRVARLRAEAYAAGRDSGLAGMIAVDSSSVDGGAEIVAVGSAGSSASIPIAGSPLRLTHAAGATVQTATLAPLGPMT
jgi:hypothetical protein